MILFYDSLGKLQVRMAPQDKDRGCLGPRGGQKQGKKIPTYYKNKGWQGLSCRQAKYGKHQTLEMVLNINFPIIYVSNITTFI